jgi:hypothetical protein
MNITSSLRPVLLLCLTASLATVHAKSEPEWDIRYEADEEPTFEGSVKKADGSGMTFSPPAKDNHQTGIRDDGFEFHFNGAGTFALGLEGENLSFKESTLECRLRMEETINRIEPPGFNASAITIQVAETVSEDPGLYVLGFYTDLEDQKNYVILEGQDKTVPVEIGRDFHVFRVVARDNAITLYVDGERAGEIQPRKGIVQPGIRFGNLRGSDHTGLAVLDYLRLSLSEAIAP